jgi:DNA-binding IclR family transcriptional regulator
MVQSVARALALLTEVADEPAGLAALAARTDLALSTASRLLATLEDSGAVQRDADGMYRVGPAIAAIRPSIGGSSLQLMAHPHLATLVSELDEAVCLSVLADQKTQTLVQVDVPRPVQAQDWTGMSWPLDAGGSGVVLLATQPEERLALFKNAPSAEILAEARHRGVAWTRDGYVEGLASVAAAVVSPDGIGRAAVVAYGPTYRFPVAKEIEKIERAVRSCADAISSELAACWPTRGRT